MKYQLFIALVIVNVCWVIAEDNGKPIVKRETYIIGNEKVSVPDLPPGPTNFPNVTSTATPETTTANVTTTTTKVTTTPANVTTTPATTTPVTTTKATTAKTTTVNPNTTTTLKPTPTTKPTPSPTPVPPAPSPSTTAAPATTAAPSPSNRKFDGPSFVGGIVLASGLMAIGFVAFKFYKARTELNYHTL